MNKQYIPPFKNDYYAKLVHSGIGAPESSDLGEYLNVPFYRDLEGKQLLKTLRVDIHSVPFRKTI